MLALQSHVLLGFLGLKVVEGSGTQSALDLVVRLIIGPHRLLQHNTDIGSL